MKISQREARRLRKRVDELERQQSAQRNAWSADYPGGTNIHTLENCTDQTVYSVWTACRLNHAVVVKVDGRNLRFYALPLAK